MLRGARAGTSSNQSRPLKQNSFSAQVFHFLLKIRIKSCVTAAMLSLYSVCAFIDNLSVSFL